MPGGRYHGAPARQQGAIHLKFSPQSVDALRRPPLGQRRPCAMTASPTDAREAALRAAYRLSQAEFMRRRLELTAAPFMVFMGGGIALEALHFPERANAVGLIYLSEAAACLIAVCAARYPGFAHRTEVIGAFLGATLAVLMNVYNAAVGADGERLAMAQLCLLSG